MIATKREKEFMKVIFDTDGTMTDFNRFIREEAIPYFEKKYKMTVKYPDKLEVEEIMDMENFFRCEKNCTPEEAKKMVKEALDKFWVSPRFIEFAFGEKFRDGAATFLNDLKKKGHDVEIYTSRKKTCHQDVVGSVARLFTKGQYVQNGVFLTPSHFHFFEDDQTKIEAIKQAKPDLVFEDKPEIIEELNRAGIKTVCVSGTHNEKVASTKNCERIDSFAYDVLDEKIKKLLGVKNVVCYDRAAKSNLFYNKLKLVVPIILGTFRPIIIRRSDQSFDGSGVVYAPNHRSTLDPLVITSVAHLHIHWAALLRFFQGTDSIFNNSKNPILCKITANCFKKLEYFPIDRKSDNPNANNFEAMRDMNNFLKIKENIGIFAEGTTRRPPNQDFGTFDDAFIHLAKKNDAWIQPITTLWIEDERLRKASKLIVNFGQPFKVGDKDPKQAMELFLSIQKECLQENRELQEVLCKFIYPEEYRKIKKLSLKK